MPIEDLSASEESGSTPTPGAWPDTLKGMIAAIADSRSNVARDAFGDFYQVYRQPLYVYLRRKGYPHDLAEDRIQGFMTWLLEPGRGWFRRPDSTKGRFRTYLLNALLNFCSDANRLARAKKRGGGVPDAALDATDEDGRPVVEVSGGQSPSDAYDKQWAEDLVERCLGRLESEWVGKEERYTKLLPHLAKDAGDETYVEVGKRLGISEGAVKQEILRLRQRFRTLVRAEIAETLSEPTESEIDSEFAYLFEALGR